MAAVYPPQGSGGGNPTGYSESGGVVTLSNSVVIDAGAIETALAAATADGTLAISDPSGVAGGALHLLDAAGNADAKVFETGGGRIAVDGAAGIYFYQSGVGKFWTNGDNFLPWTAGTQTLGNTGYPFGSLTLGDGTAQVTLGHNGATDGLLTIKDPNGAVNALAAVYHANGTNYVGWTYGGQGIQFVADGAAYGSIGYNSIYFDRSDAYVRIGGTSAAADTTLAYDYLKVHERSSNPSAPEEGQFVVWMSDGTGHGADGDVLIASTAGGTTNYAIVFDHSAGTTF